MSDMWLLDLKTDEHPTGSLNAAELYRHLINARTWGFENFDSAISWQRRMWAQDAVKVLDATTKKNVSEAMGQVNRAPSWNTFISTFLSKLSFSESAIPAPLEKRQTASLRWFGTKLVQEMAAAGKTVDEIVDINWPVAIGGVGVTVGVVRRDQLPRDELGC